MDYRGKRIKLLKMEDDPNPITVGTIGIVVSQNTFKLGFMSETQLEVEWENGRKLSVILPHDEIEILS
jgi:hypothetical protein